MNDKRSGSFAPKGCESSQWLSLDRSLSRLSCGNLLPPQFTRELKSGGKTFLGTFDAGGAPSPELRPAHISVAPCLCVPLSRRPGHTSLHVVLRVFLRLCFSKTLTFP